LVAGDVQTVEHGCSILKIHAFCREILSCWGAACWLHFRITRSFFNIKFLRQVCTSLRHFEKNYRKHQLPLPSNYGTNIRFVTKQFNKELNQQRDKVRKPREKENKCELWCFFIQL